MLTMATGITARAQAYSLETGDADLDRLGLLNRYFNPGSERFLRAVVHDGSARRAIDVGCGQGQMAHFLAELLGPGARVVGVDVANAQLEIAARKAPHPERCTWVCTAADRLEGAGGPFDLAYSRFLLQHVSDPRAVLRAMVDALAPGGLLVVEDALVSGFRLVPDETDDLLEAAGTWWYALGETIGASYRFPEQLPLAVRDLGLELVRFESHQPVTFERGALRMHLLGFEQIAPAYVERGIASEADIARYRERMEPLLSERDHYIELYRVLQVAARKPA